MKRETLKRVDNWLWSVGFAAFVLGVAGLVLSSIVLMAAAAALVVAIMVFALGSDVIIATRQGRVRGFALIELLVLVVVVVSIAIRVI